MIRKSKTCIDLHDVYNCSPLIIKQKRQDQLCAMVITTTKDLRDTMQRINRATFSIEPKNFFKELACADITDITPSFFLRKTYTWPILKIVFFVDYAIERRNLLRGDPLRKTERCIRHFMTEFRQSKIKAIIFSYFKEKLKMRDNVIRSYLGLPESVW